MLSYYRYWQAVKRLEQSTETLKLMAPDVPDMVQAQHEMIGLEVDYYRETSKKFTIFLLTLTTFCVSLGYLINKGIIDVQKFIG
jgi:hypothetical protein